MLLRSRLTWATATALMAISLFNTPVSAKQIEKKEEAEGGLKIAVVYCSKLKLISFNEIKKLAEESDATIELIAGPKEEWHTVKISWPDKSLMVNRDSDENFQQHLEGFGNYAYSKLAGGKMDAHTFHIIKQIHRTQHAFGCVGDPALHDDSMKFVSKLATYDNGICFLDGSIFDNRMKLLLGPENKRDEKAELPGFESATERKSKTIKLLKKKGIPTYDGLPVIVTDEEVRLRTAQKVAKRAVCLMAVACQAEGRPNFSALEFLEEHKLTGELTQEEIIFLKDEEVFAKRRNNLTWRYESLAALMWCLNHRKDLDFPAKQQSPIVDVKVIEKDIKGFIEKAKLRPTAEILDQNDLVYRCMWAAVEARQDGGEPKGMSMSIVYERLYALNWITRLKDAEWDDVDTDS